MRSGVGIASKVPFSHGYNEVSYNYEKSSSAMKKVKHESSIIQWYRKAIEVFKARLKMIKLSPEKDKLMPEEIFGTLIKTLSALPRSGGKHLSSCSFFDLSKVIRDEVELRIGADIASYLDLFYSDAEQNAAVLRLHIKDNSKSIIASICGLTVHILKLVELYSKTVVPIYRNGKIIQIVPLATKLLVHAERLHQICFYFEEAFHEANRSPIGASTGGGTSIKIKPKAAMRALKFSEPLKNSLHAITDCGFVFKFNFAVSIAAKYLYVFLEELKAWLHESHGFAFVQETADGLNMYEELNNFSVLVRVICGNCHTVDNSIDSEDFFSLFSSIDVSKLDPVHMLVDTANSFKKCIDDLGKMVGFIGFHNKAIKESSQYAYSFFDDIRDFLLRETDNDLKGANDKAKKIIELAISDNCKLSLIPLDKLQEIDRQITSKIKQCFVAKRLVATRKSEGGSAAVSMRKRVKEIVGEIVKLVPEMKGFITSIPLKLGDDFSHQVQEGMSVLDEDCECG